jgi:hypothetical protein
VSRTQIEESASVKKESPCSSLQRRRSNQSPGRRREEDDGADSGPRPSVAARKENSGVARWASAVASGRPNKESGAGLRKKARESLAGWKERRRIAGRRGKEMGQLG